MKFEIIGGDLRSVMLAKLLKSGGNEVCGFALDKAEGIEKCAEILAADCYILPLPVEGKKAGVLNAPLSEKEYLVHEILFDIPDGSVVFGGRIKDEAASRGLEMYDFMKSPAFVVGNAALTAEGAQWLLLNECDTALYGKRALIIGYGRIGRILAQRLRAMNVCVGIMSRNPELRALVGALGYLPVSPQGDIGGFDLVINTAPGRVLPEGALSTLGKDSLLLELASAPGGIDKAEAEREKLKFIAAPGLPGRYSPYSAAKLMHEAIEEVLKEREYGKA